METPSLFLLTLALVLAEETFFFETTGLIVRDEEMVDLTATFIAVDRALLPETDVEFRARTSVDGSQGGGEEEAGRRSFKLRLEVAAASKSSPSSPLNAWEILLSPSEMRRPASLADSDGAESRAAHNDAI